MTGLERLSLPHKPPQNTCFHRVVALCLLSGYQVKGQESRVQTHAFVLLQRGVDGRRRSLTLTLPLQAAHVGAAVKDARLKRVLTCSGTSWQH